MPPANDLVQLASRMVIALMLVGNGLPAALVLYPDLQGG